MGQFRVMRDACLVPDVGDKVFQRLIRTYQEGTLDLSWVWVSKGGQPPYMTSQNIKKQIYG